MIKSQALNDFIAEWTEVQTPAITEKLEYWTIYFDGSLMIEGAGAGIVLISPTGEHLKYVLQIYFPVSNNTAEYEALLHGLRIAISLGIRRLAVCGDFELIVNQVQKEYSCTSTKMLAYCQEVRKLEGTFDGLELTHAPERQQRGRRASKDGFQMNPGSGWCLCLIAPSADHQRRVGKTSRQATYRRGPCD